LEKNESKALNHENWSALFWRKQQELCDEEERRRGRGVYITVSGGPSVEERDQRVQGQEANTVAIMPPFMRNDGDNQHQVHYQASETYLKLVVEIVVCSDAHVNNTVKHVAGETLILFHPSAISPILYTEALPQLPLYPDGP
jgi:hypothetical protein